MGMATRCLNRLAGARKLLLLNQSSSSSSSAAFSAGRSGNHLIRLLGTTTTTTTTTTRYGLSGGIVEGNLSTRSMSTTLGVGAESSLDEYQKFRATVYSVLDFDIYTQYSDIDEKLLEKVLPITQRTFRSREWSLLYRYCNSKDIVDIKVALENELAAMCVWFLYLDVPTYIKEAVAWVLKDICSRTSEGTSEESVIRHAPSFESSFDQESVTALLVDALCSKNEEVLRQVCSILGFVSECRRYQAITFADGILNKLIQLSRNFSYDSPVLPRILFAINRISLFSKGMKEKFIEAEFSDGFLRKILRREGHHNSSLELEAYYMVDFILDEHCNDELWKYLKEHLMPAIVDGCLVFNINVMRYGATLISSFIAKASPCCIKELVDLGALKTLIRLLLTSDNARIKEDCFDAVETILSFGDADPSKNEYAKMIDDLTADWKVFYVNNPPQSYKYLANQGSAIVKMYRPDKYQAWRNENI